MRSPPQLLPVPPRGSLEGYQPRYAPTRSLARALLAPYSGALSGLVTPSMSHGEGRPAWRGESMPPTYGCQRQGVYPSPSGNEAQKPTEGGPTWPERIAIGAQRSHLVGAFPVGDSNP
jgi:hypothetical protein